MSDLSDRFEKGRTVFAEDIDVDRGQVLPLMTSRVGAMFAEESILAAGGPAWNDPASPERDRSIAVLTALVCRGVLGERLDAHLERAVRSGVDQHALEVLRPSSRCTSARPGPPSRPKRSRSTSVTARNAATGSDDHRPLGRRRETSPLTGPAGGD